MIESRKIFELFHLWFVSQTHKRDFEDFRQEDNTFRFLAMTKYDTIRSYGSRFTYQRYTVKPDLIFDQGNETECQYGL